MKPAYYTVSAVMCNDILICVKLASICSAVLTLVPAAQVQTYIKAASLRLSGVCDLLHKPWGAAEDLHF